MQYDRCAQFGRDLGQRSDREPPGELVPGREAALDEVRHDVERELLGERRREQLAAMYDELLDKYSVTIEGPASQPGAESSR